MFALALICTRTLVTSVCVSTSFFVQLCLQSSVVPSDRSFFFFSCIYIVLIFYIDVSTIRRTHTNTCTRKSKTMKNTHTKKKINCFVVHNMNFTKQAAAVTRRIRWKVQNQSNSKNEATLFNVFTFSLHFIHNLHTLTQKKRSSVLLPASLL